MRFLIVNPFGIGDVIFSTPLIEILKLRYPDSYIGYVCNRRTYEILSKNPSLNRIFIYEKDEFRAVWRESPIECVGRLRDLLGSVKAEGFDVAIDLSLTYQYSMLLKLIGVKRRLGFNYRNRGRFLTDKISMDGFDSKHVVEYYLDVLKPLGIDARKYKAEPKIYTNETDVKWADEFLGDNKVNKDDLLIGLIPGCGASWGKDAIYRRWDKKRFAAVADELISRYGAKIIIFGDSSEVGLCGEVLKSMKNGAIMACGKTSIGQFLALLKRCELVITNDGGPLHMAIGVGAKTISIFGPVDERIYGPYPLTSRHIVICDKKLSCRPCYKKFKYNVCEGLTCLKNIKVEEALDAAWRLLSQREPVRR